MASSRILKALAVTAELTGTQLSPEAVAVMAGDLSLYAEDQVLGALTRCRRELRGRLTLAEIVLRLDDGRPGVEEAWALVPKSEAETGVLTDEIAAAMGVALPLLPDQIAARMAFKEVYQAEIVRARNERRPARWFASLGHDKDLREGPLKLAVEKGRLPTAQLQALIPSLAGETLAKALAHVVQMPSPEERKAGIEQLRKLLGGNHA